MLFKELLSENSLYAWITESNNIQTALRSSGLDKQ